MENLGLGHLINHIVRNMRKSLFNPANRERILNILDKLKVYFPIIFSAAAILYIYLGYREPAVDIDSTTFRLKGGGEFSLSLAEISQVDTIAWSEMPVFYRTKGLSFLLVNRGDFKTKAGDKIRLSVNAGGKLVIRLIDIQGSVYYVNWKNIDKTMKVFNELNTFYRLPAERPNS